MYVSYGDVRTCAGEKKIAGKGIRRYYGFDRA